MTPRSLHPRGFSIGKPAVLGGLSVAVEKPCFSGAGVVFSDLRQDADRKDVLYFLSTAERLNRLSSLSKLFAVKLAPNIVLCKCAVYKFEADGRFIKSFKTSFFRRWKTANSKNQV